MSATPTIAAIRTPKRGKFITHEMFTSGAAMSAPAKNSNLIYKIAFFQNRALIAANIAASAVRTLCSFNA